MSGKLEREAQREILEIIKRDDLASFSALFKAGAIRNLSFGRFPVLSLCYLYGAKKITKNFERELAKVNDFRRVDEPFDIYKDFRRVAGKSLRLFFNENAVVSPLEMLAILHRDSALKRAWKGAYKNEKIEQNIEKIYTSFYSQYVKVLGTKIRVGLRKISGEKRKFLSRCVVAVLAFILAVSSILTAVDFTIGGVAFSPAKVYTNAQFLSAIAGNARAVLMQDISLSGEQIGSDFRGEIDGAGHTIFVDFNGKTLIKNNFGTIKNARIVYKIFEDETQISGSNALLCGSNFGNILDVDIEFSGGAEKVSLHIDKTLDGTYFAGVTVFNHGRIEGCDILIFAEISGSGSGDGNISGVAGENKGVVANCDVISGSVMDGVEVDVSGIIAKNLEGGRVQNCTNFANLMQTSAIDSWSPTVAGVVGVNYGEIEGSRNSGQLKITSTFAEESSAIAVCGGVCAMNYGKILTSKNAGEIEVTTNTLSVYCGGVVGVNDRDYNYLSLDACGYEGTISVTTQGENAMALVGGIGGLFYGRLTNCFSIATFVTPADETKNFVGACFGGIFYVVIDYVFFQQTAYLVTGTNNHVLTSDNAQNQASVTYNRPDLYKGVPAQSEEIITSHTDMQDIKALEVYYE